MAMATRSGYATAERIALDARKGEAACVHLVRPVGAVAAEPAGELVPAEVEVAAGRAIEGWVGAHSTLRMASAISAKRPSRNVRTGPAICIASMAAVMQRSHASRIAISTGTRAWRMRSRGWPYWAM